uniref:Uncharacterized protein n=1 Tax=Steinernema glaseri TaxID=37863 RepID=A0A1I8AW22_9BILA
MTEDHSKPCYFNASTTLLKTLIDIIAVPEIPRLPNVTPTPLPLHISSEGLEKNAPTTTEDMAAICNFSCRSALLRSARPLDLKDDMDTGKQYQRDGDDVKLKNF